MVVEDTKATKPGDDARSSDGATPGVVLVFSRERALLVPQSIAMKGEGLSFGRQDFAGAVADDDRVSRKHVHVRAIENDPSFEVSDCGSRNGTFVDGTRISSPRVVSDGSVIRFGKSLAILVADIRPFDPPRSMNEGGAIVGPRLRAAWDSIRRVAHFSKHVLILGESGSGKEVAARAFHEAVESKRQRPFVAVNCAAIPPSMSERLFFGTRRGAYSGADKDAEGYLQSADGGTLFLDEVAELDLDVQAKLLRVLETGEVLPLGALRPTKIDIHLCAATHTSLRSLVANKKFRQDLYFRIGRPEVNLPPLRGRREEIPWLIMRELGNDLKPSVDLVESCLCRAWSGNIRELKGELVQAAAKARSEGRSEVLLTDLDELAGIPIDATNADATTTSDSVQALQREKELVVRHREAPIPDERIRDVLARSQGNVTLAARELGIHRTQLRRWIARQEGRRSS